MPTPKPALRVFLSHTGELATSPEGDTFVDAAKRAVERAGHVSVEMNTWTASTMPPADVCRARVESCNVYVGIIGFRYGSPVRDDATRSYTELEFDVAGDLRRPQLVFLISDTTTGVGRDFWVGEHADRQLAFRAHIDDSGPTRRVSPVRPTSRPPVDSWAIDDHSNRRLKRVDEHRQLRIVHSDGQQGRRHGITLLAEGRAVQQRPDREFPHAGP